MQIRKHNQLILGATALGALTATTVTAHAEETNSRVEKNQESSSVMLNEPNITENNTQQPVDERSTLGTQETAPTKRTEEIPFKTITRDDPTLPKGERKVIQKGEKGLREFTTTPGSSTTSTRKPVDVIVPYDVSGSTYGGTSELDHLEAVAKQGADDTRYLIIGYDEGNTPDGFALRKVEKGATDSETKTTGAKISKVTRFLSKQEVLTFVKKVRELLPASRQDGSWSWDKAMKALKYYDPQYMDEDGSAKDLGTPYEEIFEKGRDKNRAVGILWFTDDWEGWEKYDTSFFEWAQKNHADQFLTVVYGGTGALSYNTLSKAGQKEILTTAGKDQTALAKEIADKFTNLVTITTPGKATTTEKVVKQPVDEIIAVGMQEAAKSERKVIKIPFKTIEEEDENLNEGVRKVVRPGVEGEKEIITTTIPGTKGTPATLKLTRQSTAKDNGDGTYTQTMTLDYDPARDGTILPSDVGVERPDKKHLMAAIDYQGNKTTLPGTFSLKDPTGAEHIDPKTGRTFLEDIPYPKGTYTLTYTFRLQAHPVAGNMTVRLDIGKAKAEKVDTFEEVPGTPATPDKTTTTEKIIKEPVDEIVHIGIGGQVTESKKEPIPFATEIIEDESMMEGEEKVTVEGMIGEKEILTTYKTKKGQKVGNPISTTEHVTKHMRTKIIHRGVKGSVTEKENVELPYTTKLVEDDTLPIGEQKVVQAGSKGNKEITRTWTTQRKLKVGDPTTSEKVTKEPVEEIIHVGTREGVMDTEYEVIPYETRYVDDPTLEAGKEVVVVEGVNGQKAINKFYSTAKGKVVSEIDAQTHILRHPTDKVIHRGTGMKAETPKVETPKVETPKVEEPKVEEPKVETPKVETPKVETPKVETPKVEEPKVETPKVETPKVETPKVETPKVEEPKVETPKVETPKVETPKVETPKVEEPKVETPKVETPKVETPKVEPKVETPKTTETKPAQSAKELPKTGDAGLLTSFFGMGSIALGGLSVRRKRRK